MSATIAPPSLAPLLHAGGPGCAFQPIVDLADGTVVAYEALARGPVDTALGELAPHHAPRTAGIIDDRA